MPKMLLFVCLVWGAQLSAQDWTTTKIFLPGQTLQDVLVTNDSTIYAVSSLNNGQGTGINVKKSSDNGESWEEQQTGIPNENFRGLASPDGQVVFAIGNNGSMITNSGGDSWTVVDLGLDITLRSLFFLNDTLGWLGADGGTVLQTTDGGQSWTDLNANYGGGLGGSVTNLYFLNQDVGYQGGFGRFRVTADGGENWVEITDFPPSGGNYQIQAFDFLTSELGYVCGDLGLIAKTTDGGQTWVEQTTNTTESIQDIVFLNELVGYACGFEATVLQTSDGGETWTPMTADNTENFRAIDFTLNRGFIVTQTGRVLTLDIEPVSNVRPNQAWPTGVVLYPNPTGELLYLRGDAAGFEPVGWEVLSLQGQPLRRGAYLAGRPISCAGLPSGSYFLRLRSLDRYFVSQFTKR